MDKKLEWKRLLIYLALAFGLTWIYFFLFIANGFRWDSDSSVLSTVVGLGMLFPLLANILTRWVTKEGFAMTGKDSLMLGISLKNKKWIYYIIAIILPWIYNELGVACMLIVYPKAFDANFYQQMEVSKLMAIISPLVVMTSTVLVSFAALGEEGGWRGYMMPKLTNLLGYKKAIFIGGVIWGVWHAPLTCIGHNFGTGYPGFPYVGILLMCVMCISMGIILTFVTEKSGSIWPATFLHAVNNGTPTALRFFMNEDLFNESTKDLMIGWLVRFFPTLVIASVLFVIVCKQERIVKESTK